LKRSTVELHYPSTGQKLRLPEVRRKRGHPENSLRKDNPMSSSSKSAKPALELISLARMTPEIARQNLRALLIANPDYFSKITSNSFKAVLLIEQDTSYESIGYVSYSSGGEKLLATIHINQKAGYSDANFASKEYVRFYLSLDGGSSWLDQGLSSIEARNLPGSSPLQVRLSLDLSPVMTLCVPDRLHPVVRTILSWNTPPPAETPEWVPVWGDVLNAQISFPGMEGIEVNPGLDGLASPQAGCPAL
jgi:hypothetical protein